MKNSTMILLLALVALISASFAADAYAYVAFINDTGEALNPIPLKAPRDVYVNENNGLIYVANTGKHLVQSFDIATMKEVASVGGIYSYSSRSLLGPRAVSVDDAGNVYIADSLENQAKLFGPAFSLQSVISSDQATAAYTLSNPSGIAADSEGNIYVADTGNNRIQVYDKKIQYKFTIGSTGPVKVGDTALKSPNGIAVRGNLLYVADTDNNVVKVFYLNGTFVRRLGAGSTGLTLSSPLDVYADAAGKVYVADTGNSRVLVFLEDGSLLATITSLGNATLPYNQNLTLNQPGGVFAASDGKVYIADTLNDRVVIMQPTGAATDTSLQASSAIADAEAALAKFASLSSLAQQLGLAPTDQGASGYIQLAKDDSAKKAFVSAKGNAEKAKQFAALAYGNLTSLLDVKLAQESANLSAAVIDFDARISALRLTLSTEALKEKLAEMDAARKARDYASAVPGLVSLKSAAADFGEKLETQAALGSTVGAAIRKQLEALRTQSANLSAKASAYRQNRSADFGSLDSLITKTGSELGSDILAANKTLAEAQAEYAQLSSALDAKFRLIDDANAKMRQASDIITTVGSQANYLTQPDFDPALITLAEAQKILYTNPENASQLASRGLQLAQEEQNRLQRNSNTSTFLIIFVVLLLIAAAAGAFFLYRRRRKAMAERQEQEYRFVPPPTTGQPPPIPPRAPPSVPPSIPPGPPAQPPARKGRKK